MKEIESTVVDIVAEAAGVDSAAVSKTATMKEAGIASLDAIEILFQLEEKFDVLLSETDIDLGTATVVDLVHAIETKLAVKQGELQPVRVA